MYFYFETFRNNYGKIILWFLEFLDIVKREKNFKFFFILFLGISEKFNFFYYIKVDFLRFPPIFLFSFETLFFFITIQ